MKKTPLLIFLLSFFFPLHAKANQQLYLRAIATQASYEVVQTRINIEKRLRDGFPYHRRVVLHHGLGAKYINARNIYLKSIQPDPVIIFPLGQAAPAGSLKHQIALTKLLGLPLLMYIHPKRDYAIAIGTKLQIHTGSKLDTYVIGRQDRFTNIFISVGASW